ncbi:1-deoxy-D-xylulose-5-phosphate reductoisomerase [Candidatus Regiella insecticola]|uniref:1-deoxy-D-xylulose 5-phosphate reductoisomerase n=1 Tax=Candidatus Regiella insecticola TaxID=138073 RepID=A0A6L2ZMQ5_9ENTR|nr:1-deoxy-D-xylulose-5-phosphate reductoisomerase [Candidatus Regiella insecticola]GFN45704.1 1-deoxy-D-xylulose 5-phosphate reductoisomerase [Candidatus Regiella insecticola]
MKRLTILGSTGSIGCQALQVIKAHPDLFSVTALVGGYNVNKMAAQCQEFMPKYVAMADEIAACVLRKLLDEKKIKTEVISSQHAACELAKLPEVDQVIAAIVGIAGLLPTLAAIEAGKRVLLANKESLITCGRIFMDAVKKNGAQLLPIDSEHNAIFQCLPQQMQQRLGDVSLVEQGVSSIILTGSGGSLRDIPVAKFGDVTPEQACSHPNWSMGRKISVDSATMMNKGLEYIEARWLFNASAEQIEVVLHPQSVIHSMVCYNDGSVLAQLGSPDMRIPIAYAMAYPDRIKSGVDVLNFCQMGALTFSQPDKQCYPCLQLAIDACHSGQTATTALNAANEVAVQAFLDGTIRFTDIVKVNEKVVEKQTSKKPNSVEEVLEIDQLARKEANEIICNLQKN